MPRLHPIHLLGTNLFFISIPSSPSSNYQSPHHRYASPQNLVQPVNVRLQSPNHPILQLDPILLTPSFLFNHFPRYLTPSKTPLAVCSCDKAFQTSGVAVPMPVSICVRVLIVSHVELCLSESGIESLFVWVEGRFGSVLCVVARVSRPQGSMGGRHFNSLARVRLKAVCYSAGVRLRLGVKHSKMACSCGDRRAFGDLVLVVEDISVCTNRAPGPPAWSWGVGHRLPVFA